MSDPHLRWLQTKHGVSLRPGWTICVTLPLCYAMGHGSVRGQRGLFYVSAHRRYTHWLNGGPP